MFLRQNVHRVLIKNNFLRTIIKKYFYATTMRPRIQYTQHSSSWRRVARIVRANRMLRDRTLSIVLNLEIKSAVLTSFRPQYFPIFFYNP